jgi:hypothetical protein
MSSNLILMDVIVKKTTNKKNLLKKRITKIRLKSNMKNSYENEIYIKKLSQIKKKLVKRIKIKPEILKKL